MPETSPALLWTGKVGDASAFRVWDLGRLSATCLRTSCPLVLLLASSLASPLTRQVAVLPPPPLPVSVLPDVTFDESVPYYRLFPYRTPSLPPPRSSLYQPVEVTGDSGAAEGAEPGGADSGGAERVGATPGGAEPEGATTGEWLGVRSLRELGLLVWRLAVLSLEVSRASSLGGSHSLHRSCASGLPGAGGVLLELEVRSAAEGAGAAGPGGARTGSTGAAGPAGTTGAGAAEGVGAEATAVGPGGGPAGGATGAAGGTGAGGAAGAGAAAGGTGAVPAVSGVAARPRPYFVPLLQQVLGLPPSTGPPPP
ncbi:unnamed protein product [Closterium sp. Naga37s-1]|nr:unnamed protein product [Closterium sp. Naga37s-1]